MAVSPSYQEFVMERLGRVGRVESRAMFGGLGLYCEGSFFALIDDDMLYFKVDDETRPAFEAAGSGPFMPFGDASHVMQYYDVPADVLEDDEALRTWVERAVEVARRGKRPGGPRKRAAKKPASRPGRR
jgi:DNA transformation protein